MNVSDLYGERRFHPETQRSLLPKKKKMRKQPNLFRHLKPSSLVTSPPFLCTFSKAAYFPLDETVHFEQSLFPFNQIFRRHCTEETSLKETLIFPFQSNQIRSLDHLFQSSHCRCKTLQCTELHQHPFTPLQPHLVMISICSHPHIYILLKSEEQHSAGTLRQTGRSGS